METANIPSSSAYWVVDNSTNGEDYVVPLTEPAQCADLAEALPELDEDLLRKRYFAISPESYDRDLTAEDFGYTFEWLSGWASFHQKAAKAKRHIIFTVDF